MTSLQNHGLIACLVNQDGEEFCKVFGYTEHGVHLRSGKVAKHSIGTKAWLLELIGYCDAHNLKIRSISSPATILGDLKWRKQTGKEITHALNTSVTMPESLMLRRLGREELFVPVVRGETTAERVFVSPYGPHERT